MYGGDDLSEETIAALIAQLETAERADVRECHLYQRTFYFRCVFFFDYSASSCPLSCNISCSTTMRAKFSINHKCLFLFDSSCSHIFTFFIIFFIYFSFFYFPCILLPRCLIHLSVAFRLPMEVKLRHGRRELPSGDQIYEYCCYNN